MSDRKAPVDFGFLLEADVQFENRVSPADEAKKRFVMSDQNHRNVSGEDVWRVFWSEEFQANRPSTVTEPATDK
ncbi:MAG TPA: hypothetical protein VGC56_07435 [Allosphingosinicella sp.]